MNNNVEEYKANNRKREARKEREKDDIEKARLEAFPFWKQGDKVTKYTGYLQLYTAILTIATIALFVATVTTAIILHNTDEKIGKQATDTHILAEAADKQAAAMQGQLAIMAEQLNVTGREYVFVKGPISNPVINNLTKKMTAIQIVNQLENVGNTPTKDMSAFINLKFFDGNLSEPPQDFDYPDTGDTVQTTESEKTYIGPRTTVRKGLISLLVFDAIQIAAGQE